MHVRNLSHKLAAVVLALGAAGCGGKASDLMDKDSGLLSRRGSFFETPSFMGPVTAAKSDVQRAVTAEDMVDGSGSCAAVSQASVAPGPDGQTASDAATAPVVTGGIALGMTECEVVQRAGRPERVEIGGEAGNRTAVLTYPTGDRAGIYRFSGGRLKVLDRVAEAPKPAKPAKPARKKPANRPT